MGFMFRKPAAHEAILFPDCRYVHTSFVLGTLDLIFLDAAGAVLRVDERVAPFQIRGEAKASAVLEIKGGLWSVMTETERGKLILAARL